MGRLAGWRVLVVGASAGIGRATARVLAGEGARLGLAARRADRLAELARELGAEALPCDVRDAAACAALAPGAAARLGGLDALVYCAGVAPLAALAEADAGTWRLALETNLVGAALVTRAALPHLARGRARAVYLSSIAARERPPRRGLGTYAASKAALDAMVAVLQAEHPELAATCVSVGDTGATEMAAGWDPAAGGEFLREWLARGFVTGAVMAPEAVGRHVADLLASDEVVAASTVVPRRRRTSSPT
jgi:NAD(P)-dependent dehydrogenase (short-subunit alcohol dehydrogenase family)